jgi:hypothetical protein
MRIRTIAGSVLAAAGLTAALTGSASASTSGPGEPSGEAVVVTCEDGKATVRPLTEEERARLQAVRAGNGGSGRADKVRVHVRPPADVDHVHPHAKKIKVLYTGSGPLPADKARLVCGAPAEHRDE